MTTAKQKQFIFTGVIVLFFIIAILIGGLLQDKPASSKPDQTSTPPKTIETPPPKTTIEKVSDELEMLKSKGWGTLASDLKRPRTTNLLWYHLKKLTGFEPKVVLGNADKLNCALAIPVKMGGNSSYPRIKIKEVDYYIIDPEIPEIVSEFDYGVIYSDPGSVLPGLFPYFRFNTDDLALVQMWKSETGVNLSYSDFPAN